MKFTAMATQKYALKALSLRYARRQATNTRGVKSYAKYGVFMKGHKAMQKKIKNLTIEETINICKRQHECVCCPLVNVCGKLPYYMEREKDLEKEIEQ